MSYLKNKNIKNLYDLIGSALKILMVIVSEIIIVPDCIKKIIKCLFSNYWY